MTWIFLSVSLLLGALTGFMVFSQGKFYRNVLGATIQGIFSICCFVIIVAAFWVYNWKIGVLDIVLIFGGANISLLLTEYFWKK